MDTTVHATLYKLRQFMNWAIVMIKPNFHQTDF